MTDLAYLPLVDAADLLRQRKLSPVEYVQALIDRIERHDGRLSSFLRLTPELALRDARRAEAEIARGEWRGPLHGVPYALKDIVDYAGLATTAHSKILADNVAQEDAEVTRRLREAGAVFLGKLSTHEFALGGPCFDLPWPPARNPWNRDHFCGGSSSGSGAATAAGFVPFAIGTDTGGSIRNPATMCGVVGMKPTYGLVSRRGVFPLAYSLDHVGPLTRTVHDNALVLDVLAGYDARDPGSANVESGGYCTALHEGLKGLTVGVLEHFYTRDCEADAAMAMAIGSAVDVLKRLGAKVRTVATLPLTQFAAINRTIMMGEAYALHEHWLRERPGDYGQLTRERLLTGAFIRAADYVNALRLRAKVAASFHALFEDVDVIVTASAMDPACRIDDPKAVEYTYGRQARAPFNVTGSPALAVPAGYTADGLPLGIQLVGEPFNEACLYRVAYAYERATDWTQRHPVPSA